ncbi:uncharacterized protein LOC142571337 isoform X3 [Dermacentor variabilis]|uniref:uncharacterized protein LOC142571337 isoform X3 n=1 Tax=Dermacentor variabilis TaxID=34621 RepID=UPI003F5B0F15
MDVSSQSDPDLPGDWTFMPSEGELMDVPDSASRVEGSCVEDLPLDENTTNVNREKAMEKGDEKDQDAGLGGDREADASAGSRDSDIDIIDEDTDHSIESLSSSAIGNTSASLMGFSEISAGTASSYGNQEVPSGLDCIDAASVASDVSLPPGLEMQSGVRRYKHVPNTRLNWVLTTVAALVAVAAVAFGVGHYLGGSDPSLQQHELSQGQVQQLEALQEELVNCMHRQNKETPRKDSPFLNTQVCYQDAEYWKRKFEQLFSENKGLKELLEHSQRNAVMHDPRVDSGGDCSADSPDDLHKLKLDLILNQMQHLQLMKTFNQVKYSERLSREQARKLERENEQLKARLEEEETDDILVQQQLEMKVRSLTEENEELQSRLSHESQREAALQSLEHQVQRLLSENERLKRSMQEQLPSSVTTGRISLLRDTVNRLIIENEDLKAVVARLRYGRPLPVSDEAASYKPKDDHQGEGIADEVPKDPQSAGKDQLSELLDVLKKQQADSKQWRRLYDELRRNQDSTSSKIVWRKLLVLGQTLFDDMQTGLDRTLASLVDLAKKGSSVATTVSPMVHDLGEKINGVTGRSSGDLFTTEVEINDAPLPARNVLTKGIFQEEICRSTGAVMSTRGRYMSGMEKLNSGSGDRALYLHIQASTVDAIEKAMARINMVIREHAKDDPNFTASDPTAELVQQQIAESNAMAAAAISLLTAQAAGHHYIQDKIFVGLEHAPMTFPVREKILGPGGAYLDHIKTTTGANVTLRGKGSGFLDPTSGREAFEPLHIHITHPTLEGLQAAKSLAISLIQTTHTDFAEWQQQQLAALTFQSAMTQAAANQQLASGAPVITGLGQVFQPVATTGEVQAQGILVSPGVMGAQSASFVLPMSQGLPSSVSYVTALPQTQATVMYPTQAVMAAQTAMAQLQPQQIQQLQQHQQHQLQQQQLQQHQLQQQQLQQQQLQQQHLQQQQLQQQLQQQQLQQQLQQQQIHEAQQQAQQQLQQQAQQQAEQQLLQQQQHAQQLQQAQQQQQQQQQAEAATLQASRLLLQQQQQQQQQQQLQQPGQLPATLQQPYQVAVPPPSLQSTITSATVYPHLRHQYAQYAAKKKYDVPPPSHAAPAVATISASSGVAPIGGASAVTGAPAASAAIVAQTSPTVALSSTHVAVPLPTDTSVPPPNMAVPPPANTAVPPLGNVPSPVNTTVSLPSSQTVVPQTPVAPPADTTVPPPTNTTAPLPANTAAPPPTDTSVPPPNYSANDGWRFRVPPPSMTVPPPLFPSAQASSLESTHVSVPSKPSTPPPSPRTCTNHNDAKTSPPTARQAAPTLSASSQAASSSGLTPLYYRSLRPQAKSSYLSSYQASALPEEEYNNYAKPTLRTNGSSLSSTSLAISDGTSATRSAENRTKKSDWEMMPPPSQAKPTQPRISSLVSYTYPNLKRPGDSVANSDWKRPRGAL